jgi:G3E family GTPase
VIVNDFGAVSIDSELIMGVESGTVSLANGCVCCEIRVTSIESMKQPPSRSPQRRP